MGHSGPSFADSHCADAPLASGAIHEAESRAAFLLRLRGSGIRDLALLRALEKVPRELFVPEGCAAFADSDLALPLGCGQTMTAPVLIAQMIEKLSVLPRHRILEIGTGSGYAAAVLSHIAREIVSFERFASLAEPARGRLASLRRDNVLVVTGDGSTVPSESGIFDRILIHAACHNIPEALRQLLAADGLILYPQDEEPQSLRILRRNGEGWLQETLDETGQERGFFFQPLLQGAARSL